MKGQKGRDGVEGGGKVYLYIVMQLCQRESLKSWLRSTSASQQRTRNVSLKIFKEICSGVEYVHYQGLIHRDLKPGNIFFSSNGTIKVIFGGGGKLFNDRNQVKETFDAWYYYLNASFIKIALLDNSKKLQPK